MYHRFSTLLRSPLRLGAPDAAFGMDFDEAPTTILRTPSRTAPNASGRFPQGSSQPPSRRRRTFAGLAAAVAAALIVVGFLALLAPRLGLFTTTGPHHQQTATAAPNATGSPQVTTTTTTGATATTSGVGAFICANPAGSSMVYAYTRADHNLYIVKGCNQPQEITGITHANPGHTYTDPYPLAWSPSNRYLMATAYDSNSPSGNQTVFAVDAQTLAVTPTRYTADYGNLQPGDTAYLFIGWLDDATFLGAHVPIIQTSGGEGIGALSLYRVNAQTGVEIAQATLPKITWASNFALRDNGQSLFYSGYQSTQEGGAWLHRVNLATGADTKIVPLGIAGQGPCQGTPICPWTAPWDVTADGAHIVYHNPGPTTTPSDIHTVPDSPLYFANADGSGAMELSGNLLATNLTAPIFSPDGRYITVSAGFKDQSPGESPVIRLAPVNGGAVKEVNGLFNMWRADSQAMVIAPNVGPNTLALYTLATGAIMPLEYNSNFYVWGN